MQKIKIKQYKKKDGSLMIFINGSNGASIGISADQGFAPYGKKGTEGRRKLWDAFWDAVDAAPEFTGDLSTHTEDGFCAPRDLQNGITMVGTDVAAIGGMELGADGGYIVISAEGDRPAKIMKCGGWI